MTVAFSGLPAHPHSCSCAMRKWSVSVSCQVRCMQWLTNTLAMLQSLTSASQLMHDMTDKPEY